VELQERMVVENGNEKRRMLLSKFKG